MQIALCAPADIRALARFMGHTTEGVAPGMGSTVITSLIIELVRRQHEVTLYTLSNDLAREEIYEWGRLRIFVGPNKRFRYLFRPQIAYLSRVIRSNSPVFVHAHWTYEFALGAISSGIPTLTTIHDLPWNVLRYRRDLYGIVRLLMAYLVALKGTRFTAVSPDAAKHFRRWLFVNRPIPVVPNFLSADVFDTETKNQPMSNRPFTFVTILQGWTRLKNGASAIRAFQLARRKMGRTRLVMVGDGYEAGGPAHRWAVSHESCTGVVFRGSMHHEGVLRFVNQEADVLVQPSLNESFSMAALECMALKKPVIAGRCTKGVRWVLDSGRAGMLVDVRDEQELADALQQFSCDPTLYKSVSAAAFDRAWSHFRAEVVVPQYEALYKEFG